MKSYKASTGQIMKELNFSSLIFFVFICCESVPSGMH